MNQTLLKQLQVKSQIYTLELMNSTPRAWLVLHPCETCDLDSIWIPKSQCRLIEINNGLITVEVPDWLARKKKL